MTNIAFIGLGIMGSPMAVHLANAGHAVAGFDRSPERAKPHWSRPAAAPRPRSPTPSRTPTWSA